VLGHLQLPWLVDYGHISGRDYSSSKNNYKIYPSNEHGMHLLLNVRKQRTRHKVESSHIRGSIPASYFVLTVNKICDDVVVSQDVCGNLKTENGCDRALQRGFPPEILHDGKISPSQVSLKSTFLSGRDPRHMTLPLGYVGGFS
jgi:hypothetical protein